MGWVVELGTKYQGALGGLLSVSVKSQNPSQPPQLIRLPLSLAYEDCVKEHLVPFFMGTEVFSTPSVVDWAGAPEDPESGAVVTSSRCPKTTCKEAPSCRKAVTTPHSSWLFRTFAMS